MNPYIKQLIKCLFSCGLFLFAIFYGYVLVWCAMALLAYLVLTQFMGAPFQLTVGYQPRVYKHFRRIA